MGKRWGIRWVRLAPVGPDNGLQQAHGTDTVSDDVARRQRISPDALRVKRYAAPAESEAPRSRCEITVVMPSPRMLTPYNASATSIVAF